MPRNRTHIRPGEKLDLSLTPAERAAILDNMLCLPPEYEALLRKTRPEQPLLLTLEDLEDFSGSVAAESNHASDKKLRRILDAAYSKMTALLDRFTDNEPVVTRPTASTQPTKPRKTTVADQKAFEQCRETSADQAAFLVAWASTSLRLAERQRNQHESLASFVPNDLDRLVLSTLPGVEPGVRKRMGAGTNEFTRAEVCGMVMAIAREIHKAPAHRQVGMLMVAMSLMAAVQAGPGDPLPQVTVTRKRAAARPSRATKKTVRRKPGPKKKPKL
jgi:hypothetical protein